MSTPHDTTNPAAEVFNSSSSGNMDELLAAAQLAAQNAQREKEEKAINIKYAGVLHEKGYDGALEIAVDNGDAKAADYFLNHFANQDGNYQVDDNTTHNKTPLIVTASKNGDVAMIEVLLKYKADVNAEDKDGKTAVMKAVETGNQKVLDVLLASHADVTPTDVNGENVLQSAVNRGDAVSARKLLDAPEGNTIINDTNRNGITPLGILAANEPGGSTNLKTADGQDLTVTEEDNLKLTKLLLEHGADVNKGSDYNNLTPLMAAAVMNQETVFNELLENPYNDKNRADPKAVTKSMIPGDKNNAIPDGSNALMFVSSADDNDASLRMASKLINTGVDVNKPDENGKTPLMYAVESGNRDMTEFLIAKGADVNAQDKTGKTVLNYAGADAETGRPNMDLDTAARFVYDVQHNGVTAHNRLDEVPPSEQVPLPPPVPEAHIVPQAQSPSADSSGKETLYAALQAGDTHTAGKVLADKPELINVTFDNGLTPATFAAQNKDPAMIELLASSGADMRQPDGNGRIPMDYAREHKDIPTLASVGMNTPRDEQVCNVQESELMRPTQALIRQPQVEQSGQGRFA